MKKIVFTFGRMNPPTIGHQKLVDKVNSEAKKQNADPAIYLSHTQNNKKDPLDYSSKIRYAQKAFGRVVQKTTAKTIIQVVQELEQRGYTDLVLVVGSDRVSEFDRLLQKYNGKDFSFNSIKVVSAGQRDPDAQGVEGMSASKLRAVAIEGDFRTFKSGLPKGLQGKEAKEIYDIIRSVIAEGAILEAVLTVQQRKAKARQMKKLAPKLARFRELRKKKMASGEKIQQKARKQAVNLLRKKIAGEKGEDYANLSSADKINVDKRLEKKKGAIAKIAKKLLPKVKKAELERVKQARTEDLDVNEMFESLILERQVPEDPDIKDKEGSQPRKYHTGLKKGTKEKRDAQFKKGAKKDSDDPSAYPEKHAGDDGVETKPSKYTKKYHQMYGEEAFPITESAEEALKTKAEKSGISYGILKKVYDRGMAAWRTGHRPGATQQQWAFARVNSFITGGKTRTTADADLWKQAKGVKEDIEEGTLTPRWVEVPVSKVVFKKHYKHALMTLDKVVQRKKKEGNMRHGTSYYAATIAKQYKGVDARELDRMYNEMKEGAGEWGTDELRKKYESDTPKSKSLKDIRKK
jgi:hypothetical protein